MHALLSSARWGLELSSIQDKTLIFRRLWGGPPGLSGWACGPRIVMNTRLEGGQSCPQPAFSRLLAALQFSITYGGFSTVRGSSRTRSNGKKAREVRARFHNRLVALWSRRDAAYFHAALLFQKVEIIARPHGQFAIRGNAERGTLPPREAFINRFQRGHALDRSGHIRHLLPARPVGHANRDLFNLIQDVEFRHYQAVEAVDHGCIAHQWHGKPSAAARASGHPPKS